MVATADGAGGVIWAAPSASTTNVIFRPGGVAGGNVYTTWATAFAAATASQCACILYVDSSLAAATVPAGTWDCLGALTLAGYNVFEDTLTIADTGILKRPQAISGLTVECTCATTQAFTFNSGDTFFLDRFCNVDLLAGATVPAIQIPNGAILAIFFDSGAVDNTATPTIGVIGIAAGGNLAATIATAYFNSSPLITGNEISGPAGAVVEWDRPDVTPPMTSTLYTGTVMDGPADPHIGSSGSVTAPVYSFVASPGSGVFFTANVINGDEVHVALDGADNAAFNSIGYIRQPNAAGAPLSVVLQDSTANYYGVATVDGTPEGVVAAAVNAAGDVSRTTTCPPVQGALTGQAALEPAVRGVTQTTQPVGGAGTASVAFTIPTGTYDGRLKVTGRLVTPGTGGGTAGDSFAQDWFVRAKTIAGVTSFFGAGFTADGPTDEDASMVGATVTFAVAGQTVVVTVGGTLASGSGAIVNWQLDIRASVN
jgi:hypothetical protein